jgi:GGDEF domain-containing protein
MTSQVSLVRVILGTAAGASILAGMAAGLAGSVPGVWFGTVSAAIVLTVLVVDHRHGWWIGRALLREVDERAEAGRRQALYESKTGLFAHWFVTLRADEECQRAARYERPLSVVLVEPRPGSDATKVREQVAGWLRQQVRAVDIVGHLGNSQFVLVLPEAEASAAEHVVARLRADVREVDTGLSSFPSDGSTFDELRRVASQKLREPLGHAA